MVKGDIVLITFPFTDLSGSKLSPLAETTVDLTVCFITTQLHWRKKISTFLHFPKPLNHFTNYIRGNHFFC